MDIADKTENQLFFAKVHGLNTRALYPALYGPTATAHHQLSICGTQGSVGDDNLNRLGEQRTVDCDVLLEFLDVGKSQRFFF